MNENEHYRKLLQIELYIVFHIGVVFIYIVDI